MGGVDGRMGLEATEPGDRRRLVVDELLDVRPVCRVKLVEAHAQDALAIGRRRLSDCRFGTAPGISPGPCLRRMWLISAAPWK